MSILEELACIAEDRGLDHDIAIFRYLMERTLYRLSEAHPGDFT